MGKKAIEKEIDGEIYSFYMLKPRKSLSLLTKIIKLLGSSIGKAFSTEVKVREILDANINIGNAVIEFSDKFDDDRVQHIIDVLLSQVHHHGMGELSVSTTYDELFSGKLKHLFKVVLKAMEVQYADFFGDEDFLGILIRKGKEEAEKEMIIKN